MRSVKKSFGLFLNSLAKAGEELKNASFIARLPKIKISSLINSKIDIGNYFYWNKPNNGLEFIAIGEFLRFTGINDSSKFKNSESFLNNWDEFRTLEFPLFIGAEKFNSDEEENELWKDYSSSEWFIPEFLIINSVNQQDSYLVFNFAFKEKPFSFLEEQLEEFFKLLDPAPKDIQSLTKINIKEDGLQTSKEVWTENINKALKKIKSGAFTKVVLSRISGYSTASEVSF